MIKTSEIIALIPEVIALVEGGQGKVAAIMRVAEQHGTNPNSLQNACYYNPSFRKLVRPHERNKPATSFEEKVKAIKNVSPELPANAVDFMSEFFRYLESLQEKADRLVGLTAENIQLRLELGKRDEETETVKALKIRINRLEQECANLKERLVNLSSDHYSRVMERARSQMIAGMPDH